MSMRIGLGFDSHAFKEGVPLVIGGLKIDHPQGLAGHSDGDLLLHAITDALLGAVCAGDIGTFFPPTDPKWKGADSTVFLETALEEIALAGYKIVNLDCVLIMHRPKIVPIAAEMRERVADLLGLELNQVSIKGKTPEGLPQDGTAVAHVVVLLESLDNGESGRKLALHADRPTESDIEAAITSIAAQPRDISALGRKVPAFDTDDLT
ncbi:2-C-methyl-D-erythritol 2,4-cyclodiphosphate synthase [Granulicella sp. 5B5]|uniref:2-C-methyl-D-erythritol 2,4-cyclodiphosphate synthase n=1 Tax=Granulicella sp. 5B5 TaxID=1617967 RepID=UPI0015F5B54E|nr:2-C-methyl-D-erythritol 2,4-cyclodiphosphate synthase [Granulicella sp. 5B5]QMV17824.1 2-C-methyl-D-erythritol 2,4-cyclodiphosphate synthase [Granulicella sp. 5B5]